jgi:hypothetical protein
MGAISTIRTLPISGPTGYLVLLCGLAPRLCGIMAKPPCRVGKGDHVIRFSSHRNDPQG